MLCWLGVGAFRVQDGDEGPNTGGMGAYCPVPFITQEVVDFVKKEVAQRVVDGFAAEGSFAFAGYMAYFHFHLALARIWNTFRLPLRDVRVRVRACVCVRVCVCDQMCRGRAKTPPSKTPLSIHTTEHTRARAHTHTRTRTHRHQHTRRRHALLLPCNAEGRHGRTGEAHLPVGF